MAGVPYSSRRIPIPVTPTETILTVPRPASRGGDGWAALQGTATAGSATTLTFTAASTQWSDFEAGAFAATDRFTGLYVKSNGRVAFVTDYDGAGVLTFASGALGGSPAAGQLFKLSADIPLLVSYLMLHAITNTLQFSLTTSGMETTATPTGQFSSLSAGMSNLLIDREWGVPGFPIYLTATVGAGTAGLDIFAP